jgi:hypothetical protein
MGMSEAKRYSDPHDLACWLYFTMGASMSATFVDSGDPDRDQRGRWSGNTLGKLIPAVQAMAAVAMAHPEEFAKALGEGIELEMMPQ